MRRAARTRNGQTAAQQQPATACLRTECMCHAPTCISKAPAPPPRAARPAHRTRTHGSVQPGRRERATIRTPSRPKRVENAWGIRQHGAAALCVCAFASLPYLLHAPCRARARATVLSRGESKWGKNGNPTRPRSSQHVVRLKTQSGSRRAVGHVSAAAATEGTDEPPRLGRNDSTARISMDWLGGVAELPCPPHRTTSSVVLFRRACVRSVVADCRQGGVLSSGVGTGLGGRLNHRIHSRIAWWGGPDQSA